MSHRLFRVLRQSGSVRNGYCPRGNPRSLLVVSESQILAYNTLDMQKGRRKKNSALDEEHLLPTYPPSTTTAKRGSSEVHRPGGRPTVVFWRVHGQSVYRFLGLILPHRSEQRLGNPESWIRRGARLSPLFVQQRVSRVTTQTARIVMASQIRTNCST